MKIICPRSVRKDGVAEGLSMERLSGRKEACNRAHRSVRCAPVIADGLGGPSTNSNRSECRFRSFGIELIAMLLAGSLNRKIF